MDLFVKKVVIFGNSGQLGQDIVQLLKSINEYDLILPNREDLEKLDLVFSSLSQNDIVINSLAMTNTGLCEDEIEQAYKINTFFVHDIAKRCATKKIFLFQISTDYVFDGLQNDEYQESDLPKPLSLYGASKLAGEEMSLAYNPQTFVFRVSSLYGINSKNGNFIETMVKKAKAKDSISVVADQFMSPTHTLDVAKTILHFISNEVKEYGIYHVTGEGRCSWYEFTQEIFRVFNINEKILKVSHTDFPAKLKRPVCAVLSNKKINKYIKMPTWQQALREYQVITEDKK